MKKYLFTLLSSTFTLISFSQSCDLINSATFSVPAANQNVMQGSVLRMTNSTFNQVDNNQWNYIVWVKTSTNGGKIYKNGVLVFSGSFENLTYNYSRLDIGAENYVGWGSYFKGLVDEVRLSNIERTQTEISNYYLSNQPFNADANTVGLWHFDENNGTSTQGVVGANGTITNGSWTSGRFGSCISYNGSSSRTSMNMSIPTSNMTVEFWIKPNGFPLSPNQYRPISLYGFNTTTFVINNATVPVVYTWSNGTIGNSTTVNPTQQPFIWVTDGNCTDTIWFDSQSATIYDTITIYDTLLTTVTDTLIINTQLGLPSPNNQNTILMFPNPTSDFLIIDNGNYLLMNGYNISITSSSGQQVYFNSINQQILNVDLSTWVGNGLYHVYILDTTGNIIEHRKIVLQ
jgi:hypothetical protein